MRRRWGPAGLAVWLVVAGLGAAVPVRVEGKERSAPCMRLQGERQVRGETLCEDVFSCFRSPGQVYDRIGLRRIAPCEDPIGPVVLYFPGVFMNGEVAGNDANYDLRLYLAQAGLRVWSLDYRTHAVPSTASPKDLEVFDDWKRDMFVDDAAWAAGFVRSADPPGPLYLAGFGFGGDMAYAVAARDDQPVGGLIILDGVPDGPGLFRSEGGRGPALDVAGTRLSFAEWQRLLRAVQRDPKGPSPVSGGKAGSSLADLAYNAPSFGGVGGMSTARDGVTDPRVLADILLTFDRWWPREALDGRTKPSKRTMPVLAFASGAQGSAWSDRVRKGAESFGGSRTTFDEVPLHGHLDLLAGKLAASEVYEPIRMWLLGGR
jgi:pimeloyl-ACP methyl ester carboxylesterase